ncbi:MAG: hypothetical protein IKV43_06570, partial [Clostridia bacterium]|nr:hypothetical protein [Clostridia bacterium]
MKKSVISIMLTLSLLLGTVLGCFSFPVAAEGAETAATVIGYDAAVVGAELQVAVNATNAKSYKLYEAGNLVAESSGPVLTHMGYNSQKTYTVSVVDANGTESAAVAIDPAKIATVPADSSYNASNLLANKNPVFTAASLGYANSVASVKDPMWMLDGDINTRYSTVARSTADKDPHIDFTVSLGGNFALGELKVFDFDGTRRCMGYNLILEIYTDGEWKKVVDLDKDEIAAAYQGSGGKSGHLLVDLTGYTAEAIRFYNYGLPVNNTDAISFWEISLSGVKLSSFSEYDSYEGQSLGHTDNLFSGLSFYLAPEANIGWTSGGTKIENITDGSMGTLYKTNGTVVYDIDFDSDYVIVDSVTVTFGKNTGASSAGGCNRHYNTGSGIVFEAYFAGEWHEVYRQTFAEYSAESIGPTITFDLGGVAAEKLRYRCTSTATPYYMYDKDGNVAGTSVENSVGIVEMTAAGTKMRVPTEATVTNNLFLNNEFIPTEAALKNVWAGNPYSNLTNGDAKNDRFATNGLTAADATLTFDGVANLHVLTFVYESANRSGKDLLVEVTYAGKTYTVINEKYDSGVETRVFNLGGIPAESVRIYISTGHAAGNCTSIREITCSGIMNSTILSKTENNILKDQVPEIGPAATGVNAANYGYQTLTDGGKVWTKIDGVEYGRFSTQTIQSGNSLQTVCMDAIFTVDETLDLGTLRIYDFNYGQNKFGGKHLEISALIGGVWTTVYKLDGDDIYAHRSGDHLAFDLSGINATKVHITLKTNRDDGLDLSVSVFEIELSASVLGNKAELAAQAEAKKAVYTEGNILLGLPAENLSVNCSMNGNHPLTLAFDGIIEPDIVNGSASKNRYATQGGNKITDANGNQIGSAYTLTINLGNNAPLNILSIYEWRSGGNI